MEIINEGMLSKVAAGAAPGCFDECSAYKNTCEGLKPMNGIIQYPPCPFPDKKGKSTYCSDCISNRN